MPKFFVENQQIENETIYITGEDVNHISNVLRLVKDNEILVCNKENNITYQTKISEIGRNQVVCEILNQVQENAESKVCVTIFQGLPKADKMEYIIQKSTELGAKKIVPVAMNRCIVKIDKKDEKKKIDRWQKIAEVAAKQSGRDAIPIVENVCKFDKITELIQDYNLFIIAYEKEKNVTLKQVLKQIKIEKMEEEILKIGVLIGPEGGIEQTEIDRLVESGAKVITLGNRILRTETASLTILSNIMYEYEL